MQEIAPLGRTHILHKALLIKQTQGKNKTKILAVHSHFHDTQSRAW